MSSEYDMVYAAYQGASKHRDELLARVAELEAALRTVVDAWWDVQRDGGGKLEHFERLHAVMVPLRRALATDSVSEDKTSGSGTSSPTGQDLPGSEPEPAREPEEAGTFFQRHIKCSITSNENGIVKVYKHDVDCAHQNETIDGSQFRAAKHRPSEAGTCGCGLEGHEPYCHVYGIQRPNEARAPKQGYSLSEGVSMARQNEACRRCGRQSCPGRPSVGRDCEVYRPEVVAVIGPSFDVYECEECSKKSGAPTLCTDCLARRAAAGKAWKGQRPRTTEARACVYCANPESKGHSRRCSVAVFGSPEQWMVAESDGAFPPKPDVNWYKDLWDQHCRAVFELCDLAGAKPADMHDVWTLKILIEELKRERATDKMQIAMLQTLTGGPRTETARYDEKRLFMSLRALLHRAERHKAGSLTPDMPMHDDVILSLESALRSCGEPLSVPTGSTEHG